MTDEEVTDQPDPAYDDPHAADPDEDADEDADVPEVEEPEDVEG